MDNCTSNITMFTAFKKFAVWEGRASRKEFWLWYLFVMIIVLIAQFIDSLVTGLPILTVGVWFVCFIPSFAVSCRRLHDTGKSSWWILIKLIPYIGSLIWLIFMLLDSTPGENKYGPNPKGR